MVDATDHGSPIQRNTATVIIKKLSFFIQRSVEMEMLIVIRVDCGTVLNTL